MFSPVHVFRRARGAFLEIASRRSASVLTLRAVTTVGLPGTRQSPDGLHGVPQRFESLNGEARTLENYFKHHQQIFMRVHG